MILRPSTGPCDDLHQKSEARLNTSAIQAKGTGLTCTRKGGGSVPIRGEYGRQPISFPSQTLPLQSACLPARGETYF